MIILLYVLPYSNFFVSPSYKSSPPRDVSWKKQYFSAYQNTWGTQVFFSTWVCWVFFWLLLLNVVSILGCTLGNGCPRWWVQLLALWQVPSAALGDRGKGPYWMEVTILPSEAGTVQLCFVDSWESEDLWQLKEKDKYTFCLYQKKCNHWKIAGRLWILHCL